MEARLPPGFRFHPRDDELVCDYLEKKLSGADNGSYYHSRLMMIDVDLNKDGMCGWKGMVLLHLRDRKYATGQRTNRATESGYWKATGKDRPVIRKEVLVGMRKTLVFYEGRAPKGRKTDWVMHEFRTETTSTDSTKNIYQSISTVPNLTATTSINPFHGYDHNASSSLPPLMDTYFTCDHPVGNHSQDPYEGIILSCRCPASPTLFPASPQPFSYPAPRSTWPPTWPLPDEP
ncbi:hypothetical protein IEQ34_015379 [Dendrobium chrysotoxum]|uniref:NAC domain-containing protein n=1 Tax=Dendrobium chrysotoxum TaxID=161865 RepID=A0AAV7GHG1_DENCH|nr:hypothetical protein IEQ34_015379 [Dendrobium chrysotoxum]